MALNLTYGNRPAARAFIRLGQRITPDTLAQMVIVQHEQWALSLENFGGVHFPSFPALLTTTLTTPYNFGIGAIGLASYTPFIEIFNGQYDGTEINIFWRCFCYNADVQVEVLDSGYNVLSTSTAMVASGGNPLTDYQWIGNDLNISIPVDKIVGLRVKFKRRTFDTFAVVKQIAARSYPSSASDIPT